MKTKKPNETTVLDGADEGRREFVKKLVAGTAFATPLLASFSMDGALIGEAEAAGSTYFAPYCGDRDLSTTFTARFQSEDKSARFNATLIADVLDGSTLSVVLNFTPRNDFDHAELRVNARFYDASSGGYISQDRAVDNLQLGPNVISSSVLINPRISGDPPICSLLSYLTSGSGYIKVTTYGGEEFSAPLVAHG